MPDDDLVVTKPTDRDMPSLQVSGSADLDATRPMVLDLDAGARARPATDAPDRAAPSADVPAGAGPSSDAPARSAASPDDLDGSTPGAGEPPASSPPAARPSARSGRRPLLVGVAVAGLLLAGYAIAAAAFAGTVPKGTSVAGVDVGGLDRESAVRRLQERLASADGSVPVRAGSRTAQLPVARAGLSFDPGRTVDALIGTPWDPRTLVRHVAGGGPADPEAVTDRTRLREALREAAARLDVRARDGAVTLTADGGRARAATVGTSVDVDAAVEVVSERWLGATQAVALPTREQAPAIGQAEVDRAVREIATPVTSGPLTVRVGEARVELPVRRLLPALSVAAAGSRLELRVDAARLAAAVRAADPDAETPAKDARIVLRDGRPAVVPAVEGKGVDAAALAAAARTALLGDDRTVTAPLKAVEPKLTTKEAEGLGVKERISTFSTRYPPVADRTTNLRIAARTVNGTLVLPGETFSLNKVLGRRTPEKGYRSAPVINGGRLEKDYGGGVSQMATTIFNNVFFAGLQDVHHMPHSFYISRYPEGREATVSYPTVDLKWRNDTPYGVLVEASVTSTVNVSFWGTKVWDVKATKSARSNFRQPKQIYDPKPGCVPQQPVPGFDVTVSRLFYKNGSLVRTQRFFTSYIAEDHVICAPKPAPAPATGATAGGPRPAGATGPTRPG